MGGPSNKIPTLNISEISKFHAHTISWLPVISNTKHEDYHINRLSDISNKASFQVLPHRKTVHDFFF